MESVNFCYWLQGYFEIAQPNRFEGLNHRQVDVICNRLNLVFGKPKFNDCADLILPTFNGSC